MEQRQLPVEQPEEEGGTLCVCPTVCHLHLLLPNPTAASEPGPRLSWLGEFLLVDRRLGANVDVCGGGCMHVWVFTK